ncbi:MAG TPA: RloB family protein [Puia sp.]
MPKRSRAIKISDQKAEKGWLRKPRPHAYAENPRTKNRSFLVVCEGQTEEQYFKSFPVLTATIKPFGIGSSKMALVKAVEKYKRNGSYDEIWCVFDLDFDPLVPGQYEDFNRAIQNAHALNYHCAYSNDAFELWFVLHYQYLEQEHHRQDYFEMLGNRWGVNYIREGKSFRFANAIYSRLLNDHRANQSMAIEHARRLLAFHKDRPYHLQNPVTTAFQLVERLNAHCRK